MTRNIEPRDGLTLHQAFLRYVDPQLLEALQQAAQQGNFRGPVIIGSDRDKARRTYHLRNSDALESFRRKLREGTLVAWGAEGSPTAERRPIPPHAWQYLRPSDWRRGTLEGPDGLRIYGAKVFERTAVESPRDGSSSLTEDEALLEALQPAASPRKPKIFVRVQETFDRLPDDVKERISKRGGKTEAAKLIQQMVPDVNPESIKRELRNVLKAQGSSKRKRDRK